MYKLRQALESRDSAAFQAACRHYGEESDGFFLLKDHLRFVSAGLLDVLGEAITFLKDDRGILVSVFDVLSIIYKCCCKKTPPRSSPVSYLAWPRI